MVCYSPFMAQKGSGRRGKPLSADLGYSGEDPVHHTTNKPRRIGIRELRQHASIYVDMAEKGYTVDITNRGRLVAQMVPARQPDSPLERWIARGVIQRAEESGSVLDVETYPAVPPGQVTASGVLGQLREQERGQ